MLRIELLPDYIHDKNKTRNLLVGWVVILILVLFCLVGWSSKAGKDNEAAKTARADAEHLQGITTTNKGLIADEQKNRQHIEDKQTFVKNSILYDDGWPEVFETIRDVKPADNSIILDSMTVDAGRHQTVSLTGFGSDEKAIVRWWMSLRNNTVLFDHVNFDLVPHAYAPVDQASNTGGMGGPGAMGRPGSMGAPGGMGGAGSMGGATGMSNLKGMMGPGGSGGMGRGGSSSSSAGNGPGELEGRSGINFTASVVLKTALAGGIPTPSWPLGGGGGGGGGMMGGSGGMMGGSGGMMGGSGGPMSGGGGAPSMANVKGGGA
jgi:hypothetical protein